MSTERPPTTARTGDEAELLAFLRELRSRVESKAAHTPLPEIGQPARHVAADAELIERFAQAAASAGSRVHRAREPDWTRCVRDVLRSCEARTVFVAAQTDSALPDDRARQLVAAIAADGIAAKPTPDDETLFNVDAAITGVSAAIAETGTIVCTSGPGLARGASLIPPVHVAVMAAEQLLPDLYDYFGQLGGSDALPANTNLISGPSKTADVEGILITGMHGPREVHVVLITP